jgi:hypothetical protein
MTELVTCPTYQRQSSSIPTLHSADSPGLQLQKQTPPSLQARIANCMLDIGYIAHVEDRNAVSWNSER